MPGKINIDTTELLIDFKTSKDKREQINILADLHCCAPRTIAGLLQTLGALKGTGLAPEQFSSKYAPAQPAPEQFSSKYVPAQPAPERVRCGRRVSFDESAALRLWDAGVSTRDMGRSLGVSHEAILSWAKRRGLTRERPKSGRKRKETVGMKKEVDEQREAEILGSVDAGSRKADMIAEAGPCKSGSESEPDVIFTLGELRRYLSEFLPAALNRAQLLIDGAPVIEFYGFSVTQPNGVPTVDLLTRRG